MPDRLTKTDSSRLLHLLGAHLHSAKPFSKREDGRQVNGPSGQAMRVALLFDQLPSQKAMEELLRLLSHRVGVDNDKEENDR